MSDQHDFEAEVVRLGLPLWMKIKRACRTMDCGATKLRELVAAGSIDGRKRDRDLVISTASILRYNSGLPPAEFKTKTAANAATS